jgi:RNA polymerase sigma-70 factor (ECF subfamily)
MQPHFDALYGAARRMAMSPADAEDLLQEVCITAFARLEELETIRYPRAWLLKVMYNRFIDDRRKDRRSPLANACSDDEADTGRREICAPDAAAPDRQLETDQRAEAILEAMRLLDAEHCALVAMHDIEGFDIAELSRITGAPEGTIKARLHRTRQKLGRLLARQQKAPPNLKVVGREA